MRYLLASSEKDRKLQRRDNVYAIAISGILATGFVLGLGCGSEEPSAGPPSGTSQGGTSQGGSSSSATSSTAASSSSVVAVATTAAGSGGSSAKPCDPPAGPEEFYALSDTPAFPPTNPVSMCDYRGEVVLVVNTAAL
jgi:hypothetical protein